MASLLQHLRIWGAAVRYSVTRQMMFRGDFIVWLITDLFWILVNVLSIEVIYGHTDGIAGWSKHEMLLLLGSALLQQRIFMGLFFTGFHEIGRSVRAGTFDFFLAQPGSVLFMATTRRLELDGVSNSTIAAAIVVYASWKLGIDLTASQVAAFAAATVCGVVINFAIMTLLSSLSFWIIKAEGMENGFFTLTEFARLPRQAYKGATSVVIGASVMVMCSNIPANIVRGLVAWDGVAKLAIAAAVMLTVAVFTFNRGLSRYTSASS